MSIGYNNMNMYMYGNNGFGNLLQQGMGMLSGGYGIGGANYFTNCYGEVNYDKMAGFQVANALLGTTFQAIAANKANKASEPQVNYTQELNAVAKEINTKEDELSTKSGKLETLKSDKAENEDKLSNLNLSSAEEACKNAKKEYDEANAKDPKPGNIEDLKKTYEKKRETFEKLKKEKTTLEDTIKKQEADIEAKTKEVDAIEQKIAELKDKQDTLQKAANNQAIDDAKSNKWQRSDIGCLDKWQKSAGENTPMASKKDLERASYEFRKGAETKADKRKAANAFVNMYDSNKDEFKGKYGALYTAIKAWLDDNPESKTEKS